MQLAVLGYCLLVPIFRAQSAWLVLAYLAFVVVVAVVFKVVVVVVVAVVFAVADKKET